MDFDWLILNIFSGKISNLYEIRKCSLDQVPSIRGLQSFWVLSFLFCNWRMDDERWYLANTIFLFFFLGEERSRKLGPERWIDGQEVIFLSFDTECDPQWNRSDSKNPKCFAIVSIVCICGEMFCVQPRLEMAWSSCLEGMPCNSDLYVYLSIEVVIGQVQWSPFLRSQVVFQILWVVIVGGMSVVF